MYLQILQVEQLPMLETRDYGLDGGAPPIRRNTSPMRPSHLDLEAQSPISHNLCSDSKFNPQSPAESVRYRKPARSNTVRTYRPERRGHDWHVMISLSVFPQLGRIVI